MPTSNLYIGLMSGTSLDGIDACLISLDEDDQLLLVDTLFTAFPAQLRSDIELVSRKTNDNLHALATLDHALADCYASCVKQLLRQADTDAAKITAIGCHGQTVRHCPDCNPPYSIQLGNPHRLTTHTGITTVADFRQADIAAGGQGAPLAPRFHHFLFAQAGKTTAAVNLGGIANISVLHADGSISGFDTGPANTLMDQWISQHKNESYDRDATWAGGGKVNQELLERLLAEPWLQLAPPKSTGPERFNLDWLAEKMQGYECAAVDVQRTLCEFSACTIAAAIQAYASDAGELVLCGGGAHNPLLRQRIDELLPGIQLKMSDAYGITPDWIESVMMAWLAHRALNRLPGNVPAVTGASRELVLGTIYPVQVRTQ